MVAKEPILKNRLVICLERVDEQNAHNAFKEKTDEQSLLETKPGTSTSQPTVQPDVSKRVYLQGEHTDLSGSDLE